MGLEMITKFEITTAAPGQDGTQYWHILIGYADEEKPDTSIYATSADLALMRRALCWVKKP
jgi:hypothetical protein